MIEDILLDEEEEKEEDKFRLIPKSDWIPEIEERVKEYMLITPTAPLNNFRHHYVQIPEFKTPESKVQFWRTQIKYCKEGYNGLSGKMYFWYNYCYIEQLRGGKIRPEFRVADNEWFTQLTECQESEYWGLVCVKRRRAGFSWKEAADVLHDCLFTKHYHVGMNSKSEADSILLFRKVKFLYNNLPSELRVRTSAGNTTTSINFAYNVRDEKGNKIIKGNQSDILVKAPTDSAFEGHMLNKWVCDEAGKIINLPQMWSYTEDCLLQETVRVGCPVIFGTSGEVGKDGAGLRDMWDAAHIYKLKRFFFGGWMGLAVDAYGNDRKEECIRWILYERKRREGLSPKLYNDFVQKYPLTVEEAFLDSTASGLGDPIKIKAQRQSLILNPPPRNRGYFKEDENGNPVFVTDAQSPAVMYAPITNGSPMKYIAGFDPADIDDVTGSPSDLSIYILAQPDGMSRPHIVFEYTDRPRELNEYYKQAILALKYYNNCTVLVERQKGGRFISYCSDLGYKGLLMTAPQEIKRLTPVRAQTIGVHMNPVEKEYGAGVVRWYVDDYVDTIPSIDLLDELLLYGTKNTDKAMAFMLTIMAFREVNKSYLYGRNLTINSRLPKVRYRRTHTGSIERGRPVNSDLA